MEKKKPRESSERPTKLLNSVNCLLLTCRTGPFRRTTITGLSRCHDSFPSIHPNAFRKLRVHHDATQLQERCLVLPVSSPLQGKTHAFCLNSSHNPYQGNRNFRITALHFCYFPIPLKLHHQRSLAAVEVEVVEGTSGQVPRRFHIPK